VAGRIQFCRSGCFLGGAGGRPVKTGDLQIPWALEASGGSNGRLSIAGVCHGIESLQRRCGRSVACNAPRRDRIEPVELAGRSAGSGRATGELKMQAGFRCDPAGVASFRSEPCVIRAPMTGTDILCLKWINRKRNLSPVPSPVIPVKAGIYCTDIALSDGWIPAFAGMTRGCKGRSNWNILFPLYIRVRPPHSP
jgi:hypothetical protein